MFLLLPAKINSKDDHCLYHMFQLDNPITLFAPTNDAFDLMPSRVKNILENTSNPNSTGKSNFHFLPSFLDKFDNIL